MVYKLRETYYHVHSGGMVMRVAAELPAEKSLLEAVRQGRAWKAEFHDETLEKYGGALKGDIRGDRSDAAAEADADATGEKDRKNRTIRAEFIRTLILDDNDLMAGRQPPDHRGPRDPDLAEKRYAESGIAVREADGYWRIDEAGLEIEGAIITGDLDLHAITFLKPLKLIQCEFDSDINLDEAHLKSLDLRFSRLGTESEWDRVEKWFKEANAWQDRLFENLDEKDNEGEEDLYPDPPKNLTLGSITGHQLRVDGDFEGWGLRAAKLDLLRNRIGGVLGLSQSRLFTANAEALDANGATIGADVFLVGVFSVGYIDLVGANITGNVNCNMGRFYNPGNRTLTADAATIGANLFFARNFTALGEVDLRGATIAGQMSCDSGRLHNPGGKALNANGINIGADVFLTEGFTAIGQVDLVGAAITGQLVCDGGHFHSPGGTALNANGVRIGESVFLNSGFTALGQVNFTRATITGNLGCTRGQINNPDGDALVADSATIGANVFLRSGFTAKGEVNFWHATIFGNFQLQGSYLCQQSSGRGRHALNLQGAEIKGTFQFDTPYQDYNQCAKIIGDVDLRHASCSVLHDRIPADHSWLGIPRKNAPAEPQALKETRENLCAQLDIQPLSEAKKPWHEGDLWLDGFTYERFGEYAPVKANERVEWLMRQPRHHLKKQFKPQPWEHAIQVLRNMGHDYDARRIARAKQKKLLSSGTLLPHSWLWRSLLRVTTGFGYQPWLPFLYILGLILLGTWVSDASYNAEGIVPRTEIVSLRYLESEKAPENENGESDNLTKEEIVKAIETFNPFFYAADVVIPVVEFGQDDDWRPNSAPEWAWLRWMRWAGVVLGWFFSLMLVGTLSGVMKQE